jgi:hypothetical protein
MSNPVNDPEGFYKSKREAFWYGFVSGVMVGAFLMAVVMAAIS